MLCVLWPAKTTPHVALFPAVPPHCPPTHPIHHSPQTPTHLPTRPAPTHCSAPQDAAPRVPWVKSLSKEPPPGSCSSCGAYGDICYDQAWAKACQRLMHGPPLPGLSYNAAHLKAMSADDLAAAEYVLKELAAGSWRCPAAAGAAAELDTEGEDEDEEGAGARSWWQPVPRCRQLLDLQAAATSGAEVACWRLYGRVPLRRDELADKAWLEVSGLGVGGGAEGAGAHACVRR
jgi:hypothetical protein